MNKKSVQLIFGLTLACTTMTAVAERGDPPNPFDPPKTDIQVIESRQTAAAIAGEQVSAAPPSPFDAPIEVVESGSAAARTLGEEIRPDSRPADNPFDMPIDIVESGTAKATDMFGEMRELRPIDDPFQAIDAQRRRDAFFAAESRFPANPTTPVGKFRFDWKVLHRVDQRDVLADFSYFLNSRDGSWLVEAADVQHVLGAINPAYGQLDFVLRTATGDVLICGKTPQLGDVCHQSGQMLPLARTVERRQLKAFLDSIARTPQHLTHPPSGNAQGWRGRFMVEGRPQFMQVWLDRGSSPIATQVPWLGMGSGVFKDARVNLNKQVRKVIWEGADLDGGDVSIEFLAMSPTDRTYSTQGYRMVTAFTAPAVQQATQMGAQMISDGKQKALAIQQGLAACLSGRAGAECRKVHRQRMKDLNESMRRAAMDWGRQHGLPVD
ncbi:MAG: hypothetical protein VXW65_12705 [Pseudomonadota bacterium]|nr:hypothetical protein [Pseudomonadota bacterium]